MMLPGLFSSAFNSTSNVNPRFTSSSDPTRKRKRDSNISKYEQNDDHDDTRMEKQTEVSDPMNHSSPLTTPKSSASTAISTDQQNMYQYEVPEQSFNHELLTRNFPHTGLMSYKGESTLTAGLSSNKGFRRQHLAALTATLHRCLLAGDNLRAGRAWGLLLRSEVNGHFLEIRNRGRWGIGAEILYHRNSSLLEHCSRADKGVMRIDDGEAALKHMFTTEGFQQAQDYYERLILQYPYRKSFAENINSLDFYPAMFSLWIFSEQHEYDNSAKAV